jgi:hypothetical protein
VEKCSVDLATMTGDSLHLDQVVVTCTLEVAKPAVKLSTTINQPRSVVLEVEPTMPTCILPRIEGMSNLTEQVNQKLLKDDFNTGEVVHHSIIAPFFNISAK